MPDLDVYPDAPRKMIGIDAAPGRDAAIVSGWRDAAGVVHIEQMSAEDRARFIAGLNDLGRRLREQCEQVVRQLAAALQPAIDAVVALHRAFEDAGIYELAAEARLEIEETDDDADEMNAAAAAAYVRAGIVTRTELLELRGATSSHAAPLPFANWPEQGGTCAHVCGPDPDHRCAARANCRLAYELPSGGTRSMPICAPCLESEATAKERAHG